jgi:hypothetical protein
MWCKQPNFLIISKQDLVVTFAKRVDLSVVTVAGIEFLASVKRKKESKILSGALGNRIFTTRMTVGSMACVQGNNFSVAGPTTFRFIS